MKLLPSPVPKTCCRLGPRTRKKHLDVKRAQFRDGSHSLSPGKQESILLTTRRASTWALGSNGIKGKIPKFSRRTQEAHLPNKHFSLAVKLNMDAAWLRYFSGTDRHYFHFSPFKSLKAYASCHSNLSHGDADTRLDRCQDPEERWCCIYVYMSVCTSIVWRTDWSQCEYSVLSRD